MAIFGIRISARVLKQGLMVLALVLGLMQFQTASADPATISYEAWWTGCGLAPTWQDLGSGEAACETSDVALIAQEYSGAQTYVNCTWSLSSSTHAVHKFTISPADNNSPCQNTDNLLENACPNGGTLGASLDAWGLAKYPGTCLIVYAGQTIPPPAACPSGTTQDPGTGQCYTFADPNAGPDPNASGEPISAGSGNNFVSATDYKGDGPFPLTFTRAYNSLIANQGVSPGGADQSLGAGWSNGGAEQLTIYIAPQSYQTYSVCTDPSTNIQYVCPNYVSSFPGSVTVWHADNSRQVFEGLFSASGAPSTLTAAAGSIGSLTYVGGVYTYLRTDGYTESYNGAGQLTAVKDPHGHQQTYTYSSTSGVLQTVTVTDSATARSMIIHYSTTTGLVTSLTVPAANATTGTATIGYAYDSSGNLQIVTYQDGSVVTYEYNDTAPGMAHALTGEKDENGNEHLAWSYDDTTGKAICSEFAPTGNAPSTALTCWNDTTGIDKTTIAYNSDGSADVTETTRLVRHVTFANINGRYVLSTASEPNIDRGDHIQSISYDSNGDGYIASITDFDGNITNYVHDSQGRETSRTEAYGTQVQRTISTTWNAALSLPESVEVDQAYGLESSLKITNYCYNWNGSTCNDVTSSGTTWRTQENDLNYSDSHFNTYTYSSQGFLTQWDGPRTDVSDVTTYTYTSGNLSKITNALTQATNITSYTASGLPLAVTDPNGVTTTYTYDARGRVLTRMVNDTSHVTTLTYYPAGTLKSVTNPNSASLQYGYDLAHRLTSITDLLGDKVAYTLDGLGNRIAEQTTDPLNNITRTHSRTFNTLEELTHNTGGMGQDTVYGNFDGNGNPMTVTDGNGNVYAQSFDALGRRFSSGLQNTNPTVIKFDGLDHVLSVSDPMNVTTQYQPDAFGHVRVMYSPNRGGYSDYLYDEAGNLIQSGDSLVTTNYTYDALNRRTAKIPTATTYASYYTYDQRTNGIGHLTTVSATGNSTTAQATQVYSYDVFGNAKKEVQTTHGNTYTLTYGYDADHNLTQMGMIPVGATSANQIELYTLDAMGRVSGVQVKELTGSTWVTYPVASNVIYEPFGPQKGLTYGNNLVETRSFDADYRVTGIAIPNVMGLGYGYDNNNNITSVTDGVVANGQSFAETLGYDRINELTSVNGPYANLTYSYGAVGSRTQMVNNATGQTTTYNVDVGSNRLLSVTPPGGTAVPYSYDAIGDVTGDGTFTYTYGLDERMRSAKNASTGAAVYSFLYDGLGKRVARSGISTEADYVYDLWGHPIVEVVNGSVANETFLWLGDRPLVNYGGSGGIGDSTTVRYIHTDQLNTPRLMTDHTKTVGWLWQSDPFGSGAATAISYGSTFDLRLPGQYRDANTGNYYNGFRDYNPATGRYLESDPIGLAGGINTYIYANGNPLKKIDPRGLAPSVLAPLPPGVTDTDVQQSTNMQIGFINSSAWRAMQPNGPSQCGTTCEQVDNNVKTMLVGPVEVSASAILGEGALELVLETNFVNALDVGEHAALDFGVIDPAVDFFNESSNWPQAQLAGSLIENQNPNSPTSGTCN